MRYILAIAFLVPALLQAQMPRGFFPWWENRFVRDLNLSGDQQRQIRVVLREHRTALIDKRAVVEKAEAEVEDLYNEETVDTKKAAEAIERLVAARSDLTRTFAQMSLRLRTVLTADQWRDLQRRRSERMGPGGIPGGMPRKGPEAGPPPGDQD